jgi:broad specificity phosphatase PhoE
MQFGHVFYVRAKHNSCLPEGDGETLRAYTTASEAVGEITFTLPERGEQKSRKVHQQLWAREIKISSGKGETVTTICVVAREVGAPKGVKASRVAPLDEPDG